MKTYKATQLLTFTLDKKIHYITEGSKVELPDDEYVNQLIFKGYLVEVKEGETPKTEKVVTKKTKK